MPRTVNVNYITKEVSILLHDSETESLAAAAAIAAAAEAQEAKDVVVDNLQDSIDAIDEKGELEKAELESYTEEKKGEYIADASTILNAIRTEYGYPFTASTAAAMTDSTKIYVYTGSETGYTAGNWYYHNGTAFVSGGVFNSTSAPTIAEMKLFGVDDLLWDNQTFNSNSYQGISYTANRANKTITVSGTATALSFWRLRYNPGVWPNWLQKGKTYVAHILQSGSAVKFEIYATIGGSLKSLLATTSYGPFEVPTDATDIMIRISVANGTTVNDIVQPFISESYTLGELFRNSANLYYDKTIQVYTDVVLNGTKYSGTTKQTSEDEDTIDSWGPLKINPGDTYYKSQPAVYTNDTCGVFLDANKQIVSALYYSNDITTLTQSDAGPYYYATDDANRQWNGPQLGRFVAPGNAHYIILNVLKQNAKTNPAMLTNKLLYANDLMGDMEVSKNHPAVATYKDKKLCVIGPSFVMLDHTTANGRGGMSGVPVSGFQEYLAPFYGEVRSYGYSGGCWGNYHNTSGSTEFISIYEGIVTGGDSVLDGNTCHIEAKDLSGYDDFLLFGDNPNGLSLNGYLVGDIGTYSTNTSPVTTFMGGLRGVVEYILNQNPEARIFVSGWFKPEDTSTSYGSKCMDAAEKIPQLCQLMGLQYIDLTGVGFNGWNYTSGNLVFTYDGTHPNNDGMQKIGLELRKQMIGV